MERIQLSKKIRFEVFKRDCFTCQYCGKKAPEVVLEVDHINPVAKGGTNDMTNLITSCFDCNRGKKDIPLSVNETLIKQQKQLELLQERREQLEMIFEWKKSLDELDSYKEELFVNYINEKIKPFTMTKNCNKELLSKFEKYDYELILKAIDISEKQYIKFDNKNNIIKDSANEFLNKIPGILYNINLSPIDQKIKCIKGIARNRFNDYDSQEASYLLKLYIEALSRQNYTETEILEDLDNNVIRTTKKSYSWTTWTETIEKWTEDEISKINTIVNKRIGVNTKEESTQDDEMNDETNDNSEEANEPSEEEIVSLFQYELDTLHWLIVRYVNPFIKQSNRINFELNDQIFNRIIEECTSFASHLFKNENNNIEENDLLSNYSKRIVSGIVDVIYNNKTNSKNYSKEDIEKLKTAVSFLGNYTEKDILEEQINNFGKQFYNYYTNVDIRTQKQKILIKALENAIIKKRTEKNIPF